MAESTFGIKKIVDCKIGQDGKQMYKVKWEPTWEPYDNLASCQHLINEFWSFVNKAVSLEQSSQQHRKRPRLQSDSTINMDFQQHRLTEDDKAGVQRLIQKTSATQPGSLATPSEMLNFSHGNNTNNINMPSTPTQNNNYNLMQQSQMLSQSPSFMNQKPNINSQQQTFESPSRGGKLNAQANKSGNKSESDDTVKKIKTEATMGNSFDNWDNPYVFLRFHCRICEKEVPNKSYWKTHYGLHTASHECSVCGKSFGTSSNLKRHEKQHTKDLSHVPSTVENLYHA